MEGRLGGVHHVKLDDLGNLIAAQISGDPECTVDTRRDACGEDHVPISDHAFVHRSGPEVRQQV